MKTYVVMGAYGKHEEKIEQVLYAGDDVKRAESVKSEDIWEDLELQVWLNGMHIKELYEYVAYSSGYWRYFSHKEFDKRFIEQYE
jgi:hypothetical protein